MPDSFGRMTKSEADESGLNGVLYGGRCWKCGGPTTGGRTTCGDYGGCAGIGYKVHAAGVEVENDAENEERGEGE